MKLKNFLRLLFYFFLVVLCFSCTEKDSVLPTIEIVGINANDTVNNETIIKLNATDNKGVSRVEVFIDDSLITKVSTEPWEAKWNTLFYEDGEHSIKTVAFDKNGNKQEASAKVIVKNVLAEVAVDDGYLVDEYKHTLVVADVDGNILSSALMTNGIRKKLTPSTFYDKDVISVFKITESKDGLKTVNGYVNVKRGFSWKYLWSENSTVVDRKDLSLQFKNAAPATSLVVSSNYSVVNVPNLDTVSFVDLTYYGKSRLCVQKSNNMGKFYNVLELKGERSLSLDLTEVNKPFLNQEVGDIGTNGLCFLYGVDKGENHRNITSVQFLNSEGENFRLSYPGDAFSEYETLMILFYGDKTYVNIDVGKIPDNFKRLDARAQISNGAPNNFSASFTGNFDHYIVDYRNGNLDWKIYAPKQLTNFKLPDLSLVTNDPEYKLEKLSLAAIALFDEHNYEEDQNYFKSFSSYPFPVRNNSTQLVNYSYNNPDKRMERKTLAKSLIPQRTDGRNINNFNRIFTTDIEAKISKRR